MPLAGRYAYEGLDRVLHEKARLGLMTCLIGSPDGLTFVELKHLCELTDGNLNRHLKALAEAGLVAVDRQTGHGRPRSVCTVTPTGREQFAGYLGELRRVIADAQGQLGSRAIVRPA